MSWTVCDASEADEALASKEPKEDAKLGEKGGFPVRVEGGKDSGVEGGESTGDPLLSSGFAPIFRPTLREWSVCNANPIIYIEKIRLQVEPFGIWYFIVLSFYLSVSLLLYYNFNLLFSPSPFELSLSALRSLSPL
jgi:hypothetical protein